MTRTAQLPRRGVARATLLAGGAAAAGGAGFLGMTAPIVLLGAIALPAVVLLPTLGVSIAILADGIAFPLLVAGIPTNLVSFAVLGSVLAALPAVLLRRAASGHVLLVAGVLAAAILPTVVYSIVMLPTGQVLSGVRYLAVPIAVAVLASASGDRSIRMLLRAVTVLMSVSLVAAIIETALGSEGLLSETDLEYGVSIRNIGDVLRAPGTFATNFHLGAFSAVFAVVALLWWGRLAGARRDLWWRVVGLAAAVGCLALSTYRTGVLIVVVAVFVAVLTERAMPAALKAALTALAAGLVGFFAVSGLVTSDSLLERFGIWAGLVEQGSAPVGGGIGIAGAASGAADSAEHVFTDNYYLSLWLQLGAFALVFFAVFAWIAGWLFRAGRRGERLAAAAFPLWVAMLAGFVVVELWEYTSAMSLAAMVVGVSAARVGAPPSRRVGTGASDVIGTRWT